MSLSAFDGARRVPPAVNEPIRAYAPGSAEKQSLKARLASDGHRAAGDPGGDRRQAHPHR